MKPAFPALLLLAACGGAASEPTTTPVNTGGGAPAVPAPHYAALFQPGASWSYDVVNEDSHWDDQDPAADAQGNVTSSTTAKATCKVAEVVEFEGGVASTLECDLSSDGNDPVTGVWIADATGLYRGDGLPEAGAAPERRPEALVIGAKAEARKQVDRDPEFEGHESAVIVEQQGDTWCWTESAVAGDEMWRSVCFGAGGAIVSGEFGWAGGSVHNHKFTLAK